MKKILLFAILFLSGAWAYTSWYWYSCHIKDVCSSESNTLEVGENSDIISSSERIEDGDNDKEDTRGEIVGGSASNDIPSLSTNDVTGPSSIPPPQAQREIEEEEDSIEEISSPDDFLPEDIEGSQNETIPLGTTQSPESPRNICQNPLVGPISLGANNNTEEVMALERFLLGRGLLLASDGVFGNDDFEAIKQFQEEFRSEVLTPWGINNPTGYVGRTTIQKIQELACR